MGAGSASVTWDMKIVDMATGELLVAIHHRSVSGTMYSTIDTKLTKWAAEFGKAMEADLAEYAKGRPRKN
jgi:hypothetical protein